MKRRDYEVFYIFEILAAAKHGISKKKLRDSVSCNGIKFRLIFDSIYAKELLTESRCIYTTTETGKSLLEEWYAILEALGLSDKFANLY
jgi:predicted transcriptional regulator